MDAILTRKTSENIFFNQTIIFLCLILLFSCQKVICKTLPPSFHNINLNNKQSDIIIKKSHTSNDHKKNNTLLHSKNIVKKNIVLNAQSSSSEPWSNAFNFKKTWGTQVDPRTGTLTAYVKVGSMISNLNHGPNINLQVSYSSSSKANIDGLGVGWRWNLAHFNPATNQLATSQGQIFNLQETKDGTWQPRYHKLHDIQITGNKKTNFVITYSNGLREILNNDGFETRLEQQNGYGVTFNYVSGTNLLSNICDDQGHKIVLTRKAGSLIITSDDTYGKPVSIWLHYLNDELRSISLSGADNNNSSMNIYIQYDGHLLNNISYPSGLQKNITYDCDSEMPVESYSYDQHYLCVVSQESTDPGANQPEMTVNYSYGKSNANEHNYLGFNSGLSTIPGLSTDVLFAAPTNYTYTTKQDNGTITQIHTYNKYHLLINVQLISDRTGHLLSSVHNFFCRTDEYDGCANTSFTDLPVTYSLPLKVVTKIWGEYSESPAVETIEHSYDMYGRLTSTTDSYGRKQIITYCPASGNAACPAEPPKWSLSTMVQSVIMQPADTLSAPPTKPLTIQSFYQKMPNITGSDYILVPKLKIVSSNNQKIVTTRQYYDNKKDPFEYGLLKTIKVTGTLSSDKTLTSVTKNYYYILGTDKTTRTTYSTIKISANQFSRSPAKTISMFTNQVLKITDPENKDIVYYHYDKQGRMIQTDSGAGTAFLVSKYYQYKISPQQVQLTIINSNGVQKKIIFDGLGRALTLLREAISTSGKAEPGKWILAKKRAYDSGGHVISKQNYYTDASNNLHYLTTTFDYDDLGRLIRKHLPDHETLVKEYDDLDRCVVNFRYDSKMVHSAIIVTHSNILDKPVRQSVFPANFINSNAITAISLCEISDIPPVARTSLVAYDGFGRAIKFTDQKGRVVTENYDALGHVTDIINPAGDKIHNVYNLTGQLVQKWIIPANNGKQTSKKYLLDSAQYNAAGKLLWKAGEDGKKTTYTYTADGQIATMTTPAGHILSWQYNDIGLPVNETIDNKQLLHTDYNPVTGLPFKKTDITGTSTWTYSDDGKIEQIQHIGANSYPNYSFQWQYDNNRRITSVTDQFGNKRSISYDALGRISSASYQKVNGTTLQIFKPFYNGFSKIVKAIYGSGMIRNIHYNNYNKVDDVYDTLAGKQLAEWKYTYDKTGNIVSMVHNTGEQQQAILHYQYDILNNLTTMSCSGSTGLPLCPRDTSLHGSNLQHAPIIISQHYFFNSLNRMTQVKEQLLDTDGKKTSSKVVNYGYGDEQAPLRLQQISIAWNDNAEQTTHFTYDATGNMMIDSSGNRMTYNAFNQITSVVNPEGKKTNYYYDGSGREIREKDATDDIRTMFYVGKTLSGEEINNQQQTHMVGYLGVAKSIDGAINQYYEKNYKNDIAEVLTKTTKGTYTVSQCNVYSPYGMVWHPQKTSSLPWYKQTFWGFDGKQTDPATGWQFLGEGHRTYNPGQRYFVSEDPAGDGYAFGGNNPIMNTDPSGNMPKWLGKIMKVMGDVGTLGLAALHKKWTNIAGVVIIAELSFMAVGLSVVACAEEITPLIIGVVALTAADGYLSIAAAAVPANKGLNIATACTGGLTMAVDVASIGVALFSAARSLFRAVSGFANVVELAGTEAGAEGSAAMDASEASAGLAKKISNADTVSSKLTKLIRGAGRTAALTGNNNDIFTHALYTIADIGMNIRKQTDKLFLILVGMRAVGVPEELACLAEYLNLNNIILWANSIEGEIDGIQQMMDNSNLQIVGRISRLPNAIKANKIMLLPLSQQPYLTHISHKNYGSRYLRMINMNNNSGNVGMFHSINHILGSINSKDEYFNVL